MRRRTAILTKVAETLESTDTFSAAMRSLHKKDPSQAKEFLKAFKEAFDEAMTQNLEDHQEVALLQAKQKINA